MFLLITKSSTGITYSPVSITPGSPEAMALTAEDVYISLNTWLPKELEELYNLVKGKKR